MTRAAITLAIVAGFGLIAASLQSRAGSDVVSVRPRVSVYQVGGCSE